MLFFYFLTNISCLSSIFSLKLFPSFHKIFIILMWTWFNLCSSFAAILSPLYRKVSRHGGTCRSMVVTCSSHSTRLVFKTGLLPAVDSVSYTPRPAVAIFLLFQLGSFLQAFLKQQLAFLSPDPPVISKWIASVPSVFLAEKFPTSTPVLPEKIRNVPPVLLMSLASWEDF